MTKQNPTEASENSSAMALGPSLITAWWVLVLIAYSGAFTHPFDEMKSLVFYLGGGITFIVSILKYRPERFPLSPMFISAAVYLIACLMSLTFHLAPIYEGLIAAAKMFVFFGLAFSISRLSIRQLIALFSVSTGVATLIAMNVWFRFDFLNFLLIKDIFIAPIGHISYYTDCMLAHIVIAAFLVARSQGLSRLLWSFCLVFLMIGIWISSQRASYVGFVAFALAIASLGAFFKLFDKKVVIAYALSIVAATSIVYIGTQEKPRQLRAESPTERIQTILDTQKNEDRLLPYRKTIGASLEAPFFGQGIGSYRFIYPTYAYKGEKHFSPSAQAWFMHPHNELINQFFEVGAFGTVAIVALFFFLCAGAVRGLRSDLRSEKKLMLAFSLAGISAIIVSVEFTTSFLMPTTRLMTALFAAVMIKFGSPYLKSYGLARQKLASIFLAVLMIAATVAVTSYNTSLYAAAKAWRSKNFDDKAFWSELGYRLAPGGFYSTYARTSIMIKSPDLVYVNFIGDKLYREFPEAPVVLYLKAMIELRNGDADEAKALLSHAIDNDPNFESAKSVLSKLP